jgi:putative solute:sodium symporter small subunit
MRYLLITYVSAKYNFTLMINKHELAHKYWKQNLRYLFVLLTIWIMVSFGAGILFKEALDAFTIGGFPIGFWFAQQGSIYVFVVLIFVYVRLMNRLDKKYNYFSE